MPHKLFAEMCQALRIEEYEKHLEELTRTQGSKKEKAELKRKIENVKKSMAQDKKGENHSQKAKK
jgi:hypothetical protein